MGNLPHGNRLRTSNGAHSLLLTCGYKSSLTIDAAFLGSQVLLAGEPWGTPVARLPGAFENQPGVLQEKWPLFRVTWVSAAWFPHASSRA